MIKALIVDDNLLYVKNVFNTIINRIDNVHINYIATNVKEALQIINNNQIDLIFLDLKLPDGSGLDIITEVKCSNYTKKPNIIILSEYKELITNNLGDNIEKNVYTYISYKHNKSINNIKTNIIKSTNSIRNNDYTTINLTPKFVISNILTEIINKYN